MRSPNKRRRSRRQRKGATAVEFAFVGLVFLTMIFTCIEFARISMIRNLMQDAAYFAARKAMVPGALIQDAVNEANLVLSPAGTRGAVVTVNNGVELNSDTSEIAVTITVPVAQNAVIFPYILPSANLTTTARMKTERYDTFFSGN
jgi:Flp pilus assembly protein TadG